MDDQDAPAPKPSIVFNGNGQSNRRPSNTENDYQQMIHIYERWSERYSQGNDERIYFSMRDHHGEGGTRFLNSLGTERREKVIHEKNRVAKLRNKFFGNETKRDLVKKHEACCKAWRMEARDRQKGNLNKLEKQKKELDTLKPDEKERRRLALLNQERILKAISKWNWTDLDASPTKPDPQIEKSNESDYGLKASVLYFEKVAGGGYCGHNPGKFPGQKFPDHKIRIEELLSLSPENPLKREKDPSNSNTFRCFHLPTNNMAWIEQAMSNYYNETIPDHQSRRPPNLRGHTERLLAREYWKGQMHGGTEHPVHARHMRPRFSRVSSSSARITSSVPSSPVIGPSLSRRPSGAGNRRESSLSIITETRPTTAENFSLFMPYLHWETNSRRSKMAEVVLELKKEKLKQKEKPKASRTGVPSENKMERRERRPRTREDGDNFHRVVRNTMPNRTKQLGPYLMSVAKIADAMDYEADERLLRDHLHADPPLHIRRTLDQSYFWTLEDTTNRDRDQVVYRGTKGQDVYNPRVVMVDQLWMWILDENTIITSFPRRWGRNKPDPSGVQKSLRERLKHLDDDSIKSVFDLALMIIDQCSRVFFDRTQPTDQRPEVMDIFSSTIAHITGMKTEAYEAFWYQMKADSLHVVSKGESLGTSENSVRAYLNVNPEGTLLRECQDVVEELRMMKRIFAQQYQVIKDFTKALTKLNESKDEQFPEATEPRTRRQQYTRVPKSTLTHASELLEQIEERKGEIEDLEDAAKRTCEQLQELLALKQQQASIIEARMALIRADASIQQGRSIMLFTIVTILFLPLSFFTSIFGMNNQEWTQSGLSIHQQFRFMFPVSFAVILVSLLLAFSNWTRSLFKMAVRVSWAWAVEHSPLRWLWEVLPSSPQQFEEMEKWYLNKVKEERQKRVDKRRDKRAKATEEKKKLDEEKNNKKEGKKYDRNERRRTLTSNTSSPENGNGSTQKRRRSIWEDIV